MWGYTKNPAHLKCGTRVVDSLEHLLHGVLCMVEPHIDAHAHKSVRLGKQRLQCTSFAILAAPTSDRCSIFCIFGTAHNDFLQPTLADAL